MSSPTRYLRAALGSVAKQGPRRTSPEVAGPSGIRRTATTTPSAGDVAQFSSVVGAPVRSEIPCTFLHAEAFGLSLDVMNDPRFPLPLIGLVHIRNVVTQHRPALVGEELDITVWAAEIRAHDKGTEAVIAAEFRVGDELILEERSHYLAKGKRVSGASEAQPRERTEFSAPLDQVRWQFTGADADAYARVSGDSNPIHLSTVAAKAFGFRSRIAHGMFTAAKALAAADVRRGFFTWEVDFASPVVLPAEVAFALTPGTGSAAEEAWDMAAWNRRSGRPHMLGRILAHPAEHGHIRR